MAQDTDPLEERLDKLEAAVKRILNLQRFDELSIGADVAAGSWKSIDCSSASYQNCTGGFANPRG